MVKRQVCCGTGTIQDLQSGLMDKSQNDEPSAGTKKKKTKGSSKVIEMLDQAELTSSNVPVDEPAGDHANDDPPIAGHQRGAKNYTLAELTLLYKCMEAAVPIGPQGVTNAVNLYNHVAKDKGWAIRGDKALRQKWDKLRNVYKHILKSYIYEAPNDQHKIRGG